jgi:hypothetical protein
VPPFGPLCRWDTWIPHFVLDQLTDARRQGLKSRLIVRPPSEVVHCATRRQPAQAVPNAATPPPFLTGRTATLTCPAQVTVPEARSMVSGPWRTPAQGGRRLHLGHNPRARGPVWWRTRPRREHRRPHSAPGRHTSPSADKVAVERVPGRGRIRQIHRHSGVFDPAGGASVLALHPHGGGSLLDITGLINDQTASGSVVADLRGYVSERLAPSASHLARASRCCSRSGLG